KVRRRTLFNLLRFASRFPTYTSQRSVCLMKARLFPSAVTLSAAKLKPGHRVILLGCSEGSPFSGSTRISQRFESSPKRLLDDSAREKMILPSGAQQKLSSNSLCNLVSDRIRLVRPPFRSQLSMVASRVPGPVLTFR